MREKKDIKLLLPIWGEEYIETFVQYSLPSLLADKNLPFLSQYCTIELIFLTNKSGQQKLFSYQIFNAVKKLIRITTVSIDDLLVNDFLYGYILSFAYLRGITRFKNEMVNAYFIFLVADYIFSENALASLFSLIQEGFSVVLSSSVRMIKEKVSIVFKDPKFWKGEALQLSGREGVKIALENLHPSVFSKIVNQSFSFSQNHQHFFWRVDSNTLISRNFMLHPLLLKPNCVVEHIEGFCDYSFISTLCQNEKIAYLNDSDDYFALELQKSTHELGFTRFGENTVEKIAENLSLWTTKQHRECSSYTYTYHAQEIPEHYSAVCQKADRFIEKINAKLTREAVSSVNHPHWHSNIALFMRLYKNELTPTVKIIASNTVHFQKRKIFKYKVWLKKILADKPLQVCIWNYFWSDFKILQKPLLQMFNNKNNLLIMSDNRSLIQCYYHDPFKKAAFLNIEEVQKNTVINDNIASFKKFDGVVLFLNEKLIPMLSIYLDVLKPVLEKNSTVCIYMLRENCQSSWFLGKHFEKMLNFDYEFIGFEVVQNDLRKLYERELTNNLWKKIKKAGLIAKKNIASNFIKQKKDFSYGHGISSFLLTVRFDAKTSDQCSSNKYESIEI